jgi:hypothetical protein
MKKQIADRPGNLVGWYCSVGYLALASLGRLRLLYIYTDTQAHKHGQAGRYLLTWSSLDGWCQPTTTPSGSFPVHFSHSSGDWVATCKQRWGQ